MQETHVLTAQNTEIKKTVYMTNRMQGIAEAQSSVSKTHCLQHKITGITKNSVNGNMSAKNRRGLKSLCAAQITESTKTVYMTNRKQ